MKIMIQKLQSCKFSVMVIIMLIMRRIYNGFEKLSKMRNSDTYCDNVIEYHNYEKSVGENSLKELNNGVINKIPDQNFNVNSKI